MISGVLIWFKKLSKMKKIAIISALCVVLIISFAGIVVAKSHTKPFWLAEEFDTSSYYYTKINDTAYYFKIETRSEQKAEGIYFFVTDKAFVTKEKFSIEKKKKNYIVNFGLKSQTVRFDFVVRENAVGGKYAIVTKKCLFFTNLEWSDELNFKKYKAPPFVKYPKRYKEKVFEKVKVKSDVVYGNAEGYWDSYPSETESYMEILANGMMSTVSKKDLALKMDIYQPEGDSLEKRPLIVFIHGGGFYIGDKKSEAMVEWCKYFAQMGYVTASVNYRLGFKPVGPSVERAGFRALQDVHAALRFLVKNAETYNIDPNYIFVGGSSAGGVTSLNLAFMRNKNRPESTYGSLLHEDLGNIESSTNEIKQKFQIKAIINMWGAVTDLSILDNAKTSVLSFHGDADKVVPIDYDYPFEDMKSGFASLVLMKMYGSLPIHIRLKEKGIREELHIFESAGHSPHVDVDNNLNETFNFISKKIRDFLYVEIFPKNWEIQSVPATPHAMAMPVYETGAKDEFKIYWEIEGGIITGTRENQVRVVWFDDAKKHILKLSVLTDSGAAFYDEYEF